MAWELFVSAPVSAERFDAARQLLTKIAGNVVRQPDEPKFRRLRADSGALAGTLFPEALRLLGAIGFEDRPGGWLEIGDEAAAALPSWLARLSSARLAHAVPASLGRGPALLEAGGPEQLVLLSGFVDAVGLLRRRAVCRKWRAAAQTAAAGLCLSGLPGLLRHLRFDGWFALTAEATAGDPIAEFHERLVGSPLSCCAGGAMRLKRPVVRDVDVPDVAAFHRLNPWEMLRVGPFGARPRPEEPSPEWWAKLCLLVTSFDLRGRQWEWSERSAVGHSLLYVRHVVYVLARSGVSVTVTMRAVWDSGAA